MISEFKIYKLEPLLEGVADFRGYILRPISMPYATFEDAKNDVAKIIQEKGLYDKYITILPIYFIHFDPNSEVFKAGEQQGIH